MHIFTNFYSKFRVIQWSRHFGNPTPPHVSTCFALCSVFPWANCWHFGSRMHTNGPRSGSCTIQDYLSKSWNVWDPLRVRTDPNQKSIQGISNIFGIYIFATSFVLWSPRLFDILFFDNTNIITCFLFDNFIAIL